MSLLSLHLILHGELKFHSYKIMIVQQLSNLTEDANILIMSEEAHFHLDGYDVHN